MENAPKYRVPSVEKAFAIMELFAADNRGYTLSEVSRLLQLPVSTVSSLLSTLWNCGYVSRHEQGRYRLTMKLLAEGTKAVNQLDLNKVAEPHMKELTAKSGLTSVLAVRDGDHLVYLDKVDGASEVLLASYVGRRMLLHLTGTGKVLLSGLSESEVMEIVRSVGLPASTPKTITSLPVLKKELARIRKRGHAIDNQGYDLGIKGVAAPIFERDGNVAAAIGVGGSVFELNGNMRQIVKLVKAAARAVSENLGR